MARPRARVAIRRNASPDKSVSPMRLGAARSDQCSAFCSNMKICGTQSDGYLWTITYNLYITTLIP